MGMLVISSTLTGARIGHAISESGEPVRDGDAAIVRAFRKFADDLAWWTAAARIDQSRALRLDPRSPEADVRSGPVVNQLMVAPVQIEHNAP
jgi:hypothetical protein